MTIEEKAAETGLLELRDRVGWKVFYPALMDLKYLSVADVPLKHLERVLAAMLAKLEGGRA